MIDRSHLELMSQIEFEQMKMRVYKLYGIEIETMEALGNGAGGLTHLVTAAGNKYVVKYPSDNEMNNLDVEIKVCEYLLDKGIPACKFVPNNQGKPISTDENGRRFTLQHFYEGITYEYNDAPAHLQAESASCLARIHRAMMDIENIPTGIGAEFFTYRRPEYMEKAYNQTLMHATENGDIDIAENIRSNMRITAIMPVYQFDINRFTCGNTHGDYMISQIIWQNDRINRIIDWTCACKHPYIWEIVRSYVFMAPEVKQGEIDINALINYIVEYMKSGTLNHYDIENAGNLFYYFIAVCNFYGQYYDSILPGREVYLEQADMASGLLRWFDGHIKELNEALKRLSRQLNL